MPKEMESPVSINRWRYSLISYESMSDFKSELGLRPNSNIMKGIISQIVDDDKMPITKDGVRAEVCLNPLGKSCSSKNPLIVWETLT